MNIWSRGMPDSLTARAKPRWLPAKTEAKKLRYLAYGGAGGWTLRAGGSPGHAFSFRVVESTSLLQYS
jgi:hypothetical protein